MVPKTFVLDSRSVIRLTPDTVENDKSHSINPPLEREDRQVSVNSEG